jgi:hypothetical protein
LIFLVRKSICGLIQNQGNLKLGLNKNRHSAILLDLPSYTMLKQSKIIHACMALHNFIQGSKMVDELFDKCDEDEYMPIPPCCRVSGLGDEERAMSNFRNQIANALLARRM